MQNTGKKTVGTDSSISLALGKDEHGGLQRKSSTQSDTAGSVKSSDTLNVQLNAPLVSEKDLNNPALRSAHRDPRGAWMPSELFFACWAGILFHAG